MIIGDEMIKKYPLCAGFIRKFLSNPNFFKSKYPKIWNAFIYACTIDLTTAEGQLAEQYAEQALTFGREPWVQLNDSKKECGLFFPGLPSFGYGLQDIIHISYECADAYENGVGWQVFEGSVLHELVHWARFMAAGSAYFIMSSQGEVGEVFQFRAYGRYSLCVRERDGKLTQFPRTKRRRK
jgi:hypothetical protein